MAEMMSWVALLPLKMKIYGAIALAGLLTFGYLYVRWKMATAAGARAAQRADALERARAAELRISERIGRVRVREREWRDELKRRTTRDHFEQGWGP